MTVGKFQVPLLLSLNGRIEANVVDSGGNPPQIIRDGDRWGVFVEWEIDGTVMPLIAGKWHISVAVDELTGNNDFVYPSPPAVLPVTAPSGRYSTTIWLNPGQTPSGPHGNSYRIVVRVTHTDQYDGRQAIAGFVDLGLVDVIPA